VRPGPVTVLGTQPFLQDDSYHDPTKQLLVMPGKGPDQPLPGRHRRYV
jgi:hypothetical protein